ncbi:MAG: TetR/AcrR family transcriptional regulator [Methanothrix sp.]|nr:MAG: TetR/AcrR family transcriptional regulator [Methanothrix sp.]
MAITDRKQREKEQRRNSILIAAEKLFYAKGYDNVSMEEIAQEAELSKGALYFYFKKKDSLFFAIVARKNAEITQLMKERLNGLATGGEKLRTIVQCYVDFARKNPGYNDMARIFGPVIWSRMDDEDEKTLIENSINYMALLSGAITEGMEDGTIRKDLDPALIGSYITIISMSVVSPLPAWRKAFELQGISFDEFLENFSRFIDPAIDKCLEDYGESIEHQ